MRYSTKFKKIIGKVRRSERGGVLVIALIALALGSLMIPPTLNHIGTGAKATTVFQDKTLGVYAADSGVEYGLLWLKTADFETELKPLYYNGITKTLTAPDTLNGSTDVQVTVNAFAPEAYEITSTATNDTGRKTEITAKVHMAGDQTLMLDYGVYALGTGDLTETIVTMAGSSKIEGKLYASGSINMTSTSAAQVTGAVNWGCENDVVSGSCATLTESASANPTGDGTGPIPPQDPPDLYIDETVLAMTGAVYDTIDGSHSETIGNADPLSLEVTPYAGSVKIEGDLVLNPKPGGSSITVTFPGDLWVTGNINVGGPGAQGSATIIFGGNVYVEGALTTTNQVEAYISPSEDANEPRFITEGDISIAGTGNIDAIIMDEPNISQFPLIVSRHGNIITKGSSALQGIYYAPNAEVDMRSGASLYGIVISQTLTLGGSNRLVYPPYISSWGQIDSSSPREITILEWHIS